MKKLLIPIVVIAAAFVSCDTAPKGDNATVTEEKTAAESAGTAMNIDTATSTVGFTGYGVGKNHPGKFKLNSGSVTVKDNYVASGSFVINMNSISMDQQGEMFQGNLRNHLMSADFFDMATYPEAKFEITGTEPFTPTANDTSVVPGANTKVSGNLTMHGVTKNVSFPAKIEVTETGFTAAANFDIDRTEWNMHYNEDKESVKDKFIEHSVNIRLNIAGKK